MTTRAFSVAVAAVLGWLLVRAWGGRAPSGPIPQMPIVNCPLHGIAYDEEREVCPQCANIRPCIV
jgi:hypothetical protein